MIRLEFVNPFRIHCTPRGGLRAEFVHSNRPRRYSQGRLDVTDQRSHPSPANPTLFRHRLPCGRTKALFTSVFFVTTIITAALPPKIAAAQRIVKDPQRVRAEAVANGWVVRRDDVRFGTIELQRIVNGVPLYYGTSNRNSADTVSTDECLPGGGSGLALTGSGVRVGLWDAGRLPLTHLEFQGRAVQLDAPLVLSEHTTHVGGTIAAAGLVPGARGMAPSAILAGYDWNEDLDEMGFEAQFGLRVSNHSYGFLTGWFFDPVNADWYWYGDATVSPSEDYFFGFYDEVARDWDALSQAQPLFLFVQAAGNDRNEGPVPGTGHWFIDPNTLNWNWSTATRSLDGRSGFDSLSHQATSKNGLTVGAVHDIPGGYAGPSSVVMSSFSTWGPCDDGRIKPDLVANGVSLFSCSSAGDFAYAELSGTSMAAPSVSGSLALLVEHYRDTHPSQEDLGSAALKALVIHTADEAGPSPGPDYRFGWGLMNTLRAAEVITRDAAVAHTIAEFVLSEGQTLDLTVTGDPASAELRSTIAWTDPPGTLGPAELNPPNKMLANDLDLRVHSLADGSVHLPWLLDAEYPTAPATLGDNIADNVEQVIVDSPGALTFLVRVTHKRTLAGEQQRFAVVITGASSVIVDCNQNGVSDSQDVADESSLDCNHNQLPDECDLSLHVSRDCNVNTVPDECEFSDCNANCVADGQDLISGFSEDCNENTRPDECDIAGGSVDDCDLTGVPDGCEISAGTSLDCNANQTPDHCDLTGGVSQDCDGNEIPDECDLHGDQGSDCNGNDVLDTCDLVNGGSHDCNHNQQPDECEFTDCNHNCVVDAEDLAAGASLDCNFNQVPDDCDIASGASDDRAGNGVPDECENVELPGFLARLVLRADRPIEGLAGSGLSGVLIPAINNRRQVAFVAEASSDSGICVWSDGDIAVRVHRGDPAPGTNGGFAQLWKEVSFNDTEQILFSAELSGSVPRGLFVSGTDGVHRVVIHGDPVADSGGTVDFGFRPTPVVGGLTNTGDVYFNAGLVGAANGVGQSGAILRFSNGSLSTIAASGAAYPGIGPIDAVLQGPWVALDGAVTFRDQTAGVERIIRVRDGVFSEVVRRGDFAPGGGQEFSRFDDRVATSGAVETYFSAELIRAPFHGLYKQRLRGDILALVLEGSPSPVPGNSFLLPRSIRSNPLGDVYFYSQLSSGTPSAGIFHHDQRTARSSVTLLQGAPAPTAAGLIVDDLSNWAVNAVGDMVVALRASDQVFRIVLLDQHLQGDLDLDDDVDLVDYDGFLACLAGPEIAHTSLCRKSDLDQDADIDLNDFELMQAAFIVCEQSSVDCNANGVADACEILGEIATDCDADGSLDECNIVSNPDFDCTNNWVLDSCDIAAGTSNDLNENSVPDQCEDIADCNFNNVIDTVDLESGDSEDCDEDAVPDECELLAGATVLIGSTPTGLVRFLASDPSQPSAFGPSTPFLEGLDAGCDGTIWALRNDGRVYSISSRTGASRGIGQNAQFHWDGAAYDCLNRVLYGTTSLTPGIEFGLYRISTTNGVATFIGDLGRRIKGLAFDSHGGILYGLTDGLVWEVDTVTAHPTLICANVLFQQAHGLCFQEGLLYTTSGGHLHAINPSVPGCSVADLGILGAGLSDTLGLACTNEPTDCNSNGTPDNCDIAGGHSQDDNANQIPDECEP